MVAVVAAAAALLSKESPVVSLGHYLIPLKYNPVSGGAKNFQASLGDMVCELYLPYPWPSLAYSVLLYVFTHASSLMQF